MGRVFDWFQIAALIFLLLLATRRVLFLRNQGVKVIVEDRKRSPGQLMADILTGICLLLWGGTIIFQALLDPSLTFILPRGGIAVKLLGAVIEIGGLCLYGLALRDLGVSWRMAIDRHTPGPLVTTGIYRRLRHPIYVAFDLLFAGTFLVVGHGVFLAISIAMIPLLHSVMIREERFLTELYGSTYIDYCMRVGRYWTWK